MSDSMTIPKMIDKVKPIVVIGLFIIGGLLVAQEPKFLSSLSGIGFALDGNMPIITGSVMLVLAAYLQFSADRRDTWAIQNLAGDKWKKTSKFYY